MNSTDHGTGSDHYRSLAREAMDAASTTASSGMRDSFLKIAAAWNDLATELDISKH